MLIRIDTNQPEKIHVFRADSAKKEQSAGNIAKENKVNENRKKGQRTGSAVAIASLAAVCSLFMLSRGFQKNTNRFLNNIKDYLEKKSERSSLKSSEKKKSFYEFFIRRTNSFIKKSESINNITSLKDVLFMKLMYKTKPTKELHEAVSKYFEEVSQKTVFDSYKKTDKNFTQMYKLFDELDEFIINKSGNETIEIDGVKRTKKELVDEAKNLRELTKMAVDAFINEDTIKGRFNYINEVTSSLYSTFWEASFKDFWSKDNKFKRKEMWQTFIAAEQVKGNKTKLAEMVSLARNAVTYTKRDELSNVYDYVKALDAIVPENDKEGIEIVKKLEWFSKNPDIFENNKDLFFKELKNLEEHKFLISSDPRAAAALEEYKTTNIKNIEKQINDNRSGMLQDMLSIYYKIAPFELEKSGALLSLKKAVKSFDKSVYLENAEFFDKVRDLRLGSAPTDILTILFSFATLSLGLGHAKDNDRRVSIALKSGIPVAGGIATAMFSAARLVSGGKSLALGFLSGIILNQLGVIADNMRKKIDLKQEKATDS